MTGIPPEPRPEQRYRALRERGVSRDRAARIANTPGKAEGRKGDPSRPPEEWTKEELYERAEELGVLERDKMSRHQLIRAVREGGPA
jgi:hypothetical protein